MRKMVRWTPEEACPIYWLVMWGLARKDVLELARTCEILTSRSPEAIQGFEVEARKYISELKGVKPNIPAYKASRTVLKAASKLQAPKEIADLKPADLTKVEFKFSKTHPQSIPRKQKTPVFEQQPEDYVAPLRKEEPPYPYIPVEQAISVKNTEEQKNKLELLQKLGQLNEKALCGKDLVDLTGSDFDVDKKNINLQPETLEEVLKIAKRAGATKVQYKDYIIKFS